VNDVLKTGQWKCPPGVPLNKVFKFLELLILPFLFSTSLWAQNAYVNFEGKQTSPVRLSPDGTRLFAANTPDGRLSVFDFTQPSNPRLLAEIPVGL